jgi:hypothetical protein
VPGWLAAALSLVWLAGCAGSQAAAPRGPPPGITGTVNRAADATVTLKIAIPLPAANARRRPRYVSPGTQSISVALLQGSTTVFTFVQNVSTSSGCVPGSGTLTCTLTFNAISGSYTADIIAYALPGTTGAQLSASYGSAMTLVPGTNDISVTLSGIAASFAATPPSDQHVTAGGSGYWIVGGASYPYPAYTFTIDALDGANDPIAGLGAPALTVTSSNSSVISVTPVNGSADEFAVQVLAGSTSAVNLNVSAAAVPHSGATPASTAIPLTSAQITSIDGAGMQGWSFQNDCGVGTLGSGGLLGQLVSGPASPPLGTGSVELAIPSVQSDPNALRECVMLATTAFGGTALSNLTALHYSSYQAASDLPDAITLQFDVAYNVGDPYEGRLVFEPYLGGTVAAGWQSWNALAGRWWGDDPPGSTLCPQTSPCTWSQVLADWPNASIRTGDNVLFKAGSGWQAFDGNVDEFIIGIGGANTVYQFSP